MSGYRRNETTKLEEAPQKSSIVLVDKRSGGGDEDNVPRRRKAHVRVRNELRP